MCNIDVPPEDRSSNDSRPATLGCGLEAVAGVARGILCVSHTVQRRCASDRSSNDSRPAALGCGLEAVAGVAHGILCVSHNGARRRCSSENT